MPTRSPPSSLVRSAGRRLPDLLRLVILVAGLAATTTGDREAAIKCMLLVPPAVLSRSVRAPLAFEFVFMLALAIEATASVLGLNRTGAWNTMAHVVLPFLSGPLLYQGFV